MDDKIVALVRCGFTPDNAKCVVQQYTKSDNLVGLDKFIALAKKIHESGGDIL